MDQRLLLAITLSILVLVGYYALFPPPAPKRPKSPPSQAQQTTKSGEKAAAPAASAAAVTAPATQAAQPAVPQAAAPASQATPAPQGKIVEVDTPRYTAKFDTRGGGLVSMRLHRYLVYKQNINWADIIPPLRAYLHKPKVDPNAHVEMVKRKLPGDGMFGVKFVGEDSLSKQFRNVTFQASREQIRIDRTQGPPERLVLTGRGPDGLTLVKTFTFHPGSYIIDYGLSVINYGKAARSMRVESLFGEGPATGDVGAYRRHAGPIWREDGKVKTENTGDIEGQLIVRQPQWLGISDTYFISAVEAKSRIDHAFYDATSLTQGDKKVWVADYGAELPQVGLQPEKMISSEFKVYLGPKKDSEMAKFGAKLTQSLDLTLDILARPMLALMRWFYSFTGNYGVAIILLTVVVRVLLFPLTYRGMLNIKRMQKLQPKIAALRDKFKNDKERLNKEMMGMYKRYKMNPLGGCLPIALQIPIFFALYSALLGAIELRHSPFALWITDLSAKDGLYITPVLMGVSMFLQQKLSPTTPDPTQAKIMLWMPVIFTVFMVNFPSGLVLYWLTSNVLSILQQVIINRAHVPEPVEQPA